MSNKRKKLVFIEIVQPKVEESVFTKIIKLKVKELEIKQPIIIQPKNNSLYMDDTIMKIKNTIHKVQPTIAEYIKLVDDKKLSLSLLLLLLLYKLK